MGLSWLPGPTVGALRDGLRVVMPELAGGVIEPRGLEASDDPRWCAASAVVDGRFVVKFAWAEPPALRIVHEGRVLAALRGLPLPDVVALSTDPAMLVTLREAAVPFFAVRHRAGPEAAQDLATALATLHGHQGLTLPAAARPVTTEALRARWTEQRDRVLPWCDWADEVLATPGRTVLVHGDFHGDNHLWDRETVRLRLVVDWETAGAGEPEFDLRCLPGDCGAELFAATVAHYEGLTGASLDVDRVLAWHLRTVLDDVLWRTEAGVALPDGRTPAQWVDALERRLRTRPGFAPPAGR